jgi:hypothetical protein
LKDDDIGERGNHRRFRVTEALGWLRREFSTRRLDNPVLFMFSPLSLNEPLCHNDLTIIVTSPLVIKGRKKSKVNCFNAHFSKVIERYC